MNPRRSAFMLQADGRGQRFCLLTEPQGPARGALLYVHPFAEEMNKSRRMAALAAEALAREGWRVLQVDLLGCGDSGGDFGDASWEGWLADIDLAWQWLHSETPGKVCLWSLRAGSLLVADWIRTRASAPPLLMWQPVTDGRQHLTQFLRLKGVSQMLEESDAKAAMAAVRAALESGQPVEVAGYLLAPSLVRGLQAARLDLPDGYGARVAALEVTPAERCEPSPALVRAVERWQAHGCTVSAAACAGPSFWQTVEIETCPALIAASVTAVEELTA